MENLIKVAQEWAAADPDPATAQQILDLVAQVEAGDAEANTKLQSCFAGPLQFGTAGLRGQIGAGESRMNVAVVIRATYGLVQYLKSLVERPRVVVGCDARYGSADFAKAAARVISAAGGEALVLPQANPTPLTSFTVRHLGADAGVMVTASHNPAQDNGYKVYLGGRVATGDGEGVQIIPPADSLIAAEIAAAPGANQIPQDDTNITSVDTRDQYVERAATLGKAAHPLKIVLTAMHGVGAPLAIASLTAAGFKDIIPVREQIDPDPDFPTVPFPNPEEKGATDLAIKYAVENGADLIIALDPDADRCAVAVPEGDTFRQLSGDETGYLLGDYVATHAATGTLACSIVSGRLLGKIAVGHGLKFKQTLTGFKWIARTPGLVYGYEEAIGHCVDPENVHDKDGISAAVKFAVLLSELKAHGSDALEKLDELAKTYGTHLTSPLTFRFTDTSKIGEALERIQKTPPQTILGAPIAECVDLAGGYRDIPGTKGLLLANENDARVIIRPSGTEPKLKCYLEVVLDTPTEGPVPWDEARAQMQAFKAEIATALGMEVPQ
ncbi:MAG: phospho-sugar mutase [Actinomycetaceae bacterium]|nr:phospho-sugar mutase [Actinomycetaceae bacterium]